MYIEFVIADNFILTYLSAVTAIRLCHKRICVWRCLVASTLGTIVAVFYPFIPISNVALVGVKLLLGACLSFILFIKTKKGIIATVIFLLSTFTYGGSCYAVGLALYSSTSKATTFCAKTPLFLVLCCGVVIYFVVRFAIKKMRIYKANAPYEYMVDMKVLGKNVSFNAFLDTGNCVFDERSGMPVMVTSVDIFSSKLDNVSMIEFIKNVDRFRHINVATPTGSGRIYLVKPTEVTVYSDKRPHKINAMLGLSSGVSLSSKHELLLGAMMGEEEL